MASRGDVVAAGVLIASAVVFGANIVPILKRGVEPERPAKLAADDPVKDWVSFAVMWGFTVIAFDAFASYVDIYRRTGSVPTLSDIEERFQ